MITRYLAAFGGGHAHVVWTGRPPGGGRLASSSPAHPPGRQRSRAVRRPQALLPDPDTPAPPRFLPTYDNVLLSHDDRSRIIGEDDRRRLTAGSYEGNFGTVLIDGFARARWEIVRQRPTATLLITPLKSLTNRDGAAVTDEGVRLLPFAAADAEKHDVRLASADR